MAEVTVAIAGRSYRMACGDGDELRLERLAARFDGRIEELRVAFGEIGDMRLHVMAALTLVDELDECQDRLQALQGELDIVKRRLDAGDQRAQASEMYVADTLARTAERIERLARSLNAATPAGGHAAASRAEAGPAGR